MASRSFEMDDGLVEEKKNDLYIPAISRQLGQQYEERGEQATQPFFNNQNTIIMAARSCNGDIMLMHETRIFYFSKTEDIKTQSTITDDDSNYAKAVDHNTKLLLDMLTTRKYRLLTSFYLLWRILDYGMLTALILTIFFEREPAKFSNIISSNIWIFAVVALEIFYDVLEFIVKIWFLNRVSIYIGIVLYILYTITFQWYQVWESLVNMLFILRAISFIFEEAIDFCIDLELEYDLTTKAINKLDLWSKTEHEERIALLNVSPIRNEITLYSGWEFKGSICAWTPKNTFKCDINRKQNIDKSMYYKCYQHIFQFMFLITYFIGIPLLIIIFLSVITLKLLTFCCGCFNCCKDKGGDTILDECLNHRYSY